MNLELLPSSTKTHDAKTIVSNPSDEKLVQIKMTGGTKGIILYEKPDYLIVLQLHKSQIRLIYNGEGELVWKRCRDIQKNGQKSIALSTLESLNNIAAQKLTQVRGFPILN